MKKNFLKILQNGLSARLFLIFGVILVVFFSFGVVREYFKRQELDKELAGLEQELENLKLKKKTFLSSIESYKGEFFLEQEARTKFNFKKPGEKVAVIPVSKLIESTASQSLPLGTDSGTSQYRGRAKINSAAWWNYFFGEKKS